jgi:hypothetical protein
MRLLVLERPVTFLNISRENAYGALFCGSSSILMLVSLVTIQHSQDRVVQSGTLIMRNAQED